MMPSFIDGSNAGRFVDTTNAAESEPNTLVPVPVDDFDVSARLDRIERAINQLGEQNTWIVQTLSAAFQGFQEMQEQIRQGGPLALIKQMMSKG